MLIHRRNETSVEPSAANNSSEAYSGNKLVVISILFVILSTIIVTLRCYARSLTRAVYGWDDYLVFAGFISNAALSVVSILIVYYGGVGRHVLDVMKDDPELMVGWAKGIFAIELIYLASVALPKLSALCFYLRVFVYRKGRVFAYIIIGLVTLNWVVFSISAILQCRPIAYWWDKTIQGGTCFNVQVFYRAMCVPNIATDVMVLLLPISSLVQLKLPLLKKIALCFIFLTASVGMLASIYRFTIFFTTDAFTDPTWASVLLVGWSVVESGMYLIAACLPLLRPVIEKVIPKNWKVVFSPPSSRFKYSEYSMEQSSKSKAAPSNTTKLSTYDETLDDLNCLEPCGKGTFVNEVNGRSVSETCLVHPEGIEVTNEISVSLATPNNNNNNNAITDSRNQQS